MLDNAVLNDLWMAYGLEWGHPYFRHTSNASVVSTSSRNCVFRSNIEHGLELHMVAVTSDCLSRVFRRSTKQRLELETLVYWGGARL